MLWVTCAQMSEKVTNERSDSEAVSGSTTTPGIAEDFAVKHRPLYLH
jgi:hypothetical protein